MMASRRTDVCCTGSGSTSETSWLRSAQTRRRSWRSLDSSLGYLGCPYPAEAGAVGRGAVAELAGRDAGGISRSVRRVHRRQIPVRGWGVFESLGYFACGPVGLVHTQKIGNSIRKAHLD